MFVIPPIPEMEIHRITVPVWAKKSAIPHLNKEARHGGAYL
jgi:hypothetical protein